MIKNIQYSNYPSHFKIKLSLPGAKLIKYISDIFTTLRPLAFFLNSCPDCFVKLDTKHADLISLIFFNLNANFLLMILILRFSNIFPLGDIKYICT